MTTAALFNPEDVVDLLRVGVALRWTLAEFADRVCQAHKWRQEIAHVRGLDHVRGTRSLIVCTLCAEDDTLECENCGCAPGVGVACNECDCHLPACRACFAACDTMTARYCYDCGKSDADNARVDAARDA